MVSKLLVATGCGLVGIIVFLGGCSSTKEVRITSSPEGAAVVIDGTSSGATPVSKELSFKEQPTHEVILKKDGYEDGKLSITLEPKDTTSYSLNLIELAKNVAITSEPKGVVVSIDGVDSGPTPVSKELMFGRVKTHEIVAKKDGYEDAKVTIEFDPQEKTLYHLKLKEVIKKATILSEPQGATVIVNGVEAGVTPLSKDFTFGQRKVHDVVIKKVGFEDASAIVELLPKNKGEYSVKLKPITKVVTITTEPRGATLIIDGSASVMAPVTRELAFGERKSFQVTAKKDGYEEKKFIIESSPQDKHIYDVTLTKIETASIDLLSLEPQNTDKGIRFAVNRIPTVAYLEPMERSSNVQSVTRVTANEDKNLQIGPPVIAASDSTLVYRALVVDDSKTILSNLWRHSIGGGSAKTRITVGNWLDMFPTLSPDGQFLVFSSNRLSANPTLWRVKLLGGGGLTKITSGTSADYEPSVTPDGQTIVFTSLPPGSNEPQIWSIDIRNGLSTQLKEGESPRVSPDGKKIVFIRKDKTNGFKQMWVMNIDGTEETLLSQSADHDEIDASWSPDSKWIVFASNEGPDPQKRNFDIWIVGEDGSARSQLTTNGSRDDGPAFDRTGQSVYFRSNRGGVWNIWRFELPKM